MTLRIKPCENCGHKKFKTVIKGMRWSCRRCGALRYESKELA